jgi:hypothetical protein
LLAQMRAAPNVEQLRIEMVHEFGAAVIELP